MYPSCTFQDKSIINRFDKKVTFFLFKLSVALVIEGNRRYNKIMSIRMPRTLLSGSIFHQEEL